MIIMWGYPSNVNDTKSASADDWDSCVKYCSNDVNCVLVFSNSRTSPTNCYYSYFAMAEIIQLTDNESNKGVVALKVNKPEQCPKLLIDNFPAAGETPTGSYNISYNPNSNTISLENGFKTCFNDPKWIPFVRNGRNWCIKMVVVALINRIEAVKRCIAENAVLTGLSSPLEAFSYNKLLSYNYEEISYGPYGLRRVWVDGIRSAKCMSNGKPICDIFEFSSNYMDGPMNNDIFFVTEPSRMNGVEVENCAALASVAYNPSYGSHCLHDISCDYNVQGYLCGKWEDQ